MNYDSYGNRTQSNWQTAACSPTSDPATASYNAANRVTWTTVNSAVNGFTYDAAGNVTNDGANQYLYDGEGRVCAVQTNSISGGVAIYGYIYDAEGRRVAKGSQTTFSCDLGSNGFTLTESYVLGQSGEQLTTLDGSQNWERTNVYGGGQLLATYDTVGLHFQLTDPLGTRRVQASAVGQAEEDCQGLPFGDGLNCYSVASAPATADDSTPLHFTGKERDTESGNDYFGARYYASAMGRFMSPDPSQLYFANPTNPQSFNLYNYSWNNPLTNIDPSGMDACATDNGDGTATIVNAADGGAVDCSGNGSYITTTQQVSAVGFNENGDLSMYGADGNLYNPDGSAYNVTQSITVNADGGSSYIGPPTVDSPGLQYVTSMPAPNSGYKGYYPDYSSLFCAGDALNNNGVALGLDAAGLFIPGESQVAAGVQTGVAAASFVNSMNHADGKGAGMAYTAGLLAATGSLAKQTGLSAAKAIPFAGYFVSGAAIAHDLEGASNDYETCMAGGK